MLKLLRHGVIAILALLPLVAPLLSGHSDLAIGTRLAGGFMVQVPLLPPNVWGTTHLAVPSGRWRDELTGTEYESRGTLLLREVLAKLPVALLRRV